MRYLVKWSVTEHIYRQGQNICASGKVEKEGEESALRSELLALLHASFPKHELRGTYDIDRTYDISFEELT